MNAQVPKVLIIILNYGTYQLTIDLVKQIREKLIYSNYQIMVIDNNSQNESAKVLADHANVYGYIFYANTANTGYAAGNNIGIRYSIEHDYDYSWILNSDVDIRSGDVLSRMVLDAQKDKSIGCVGPMIFNADGSICPPYCRRPSVWSMTLGIVNEKRYRKTQIYKSRKVYRVYGCCMLLDNSAMAAVDCMDESTFLYSEEAILAERLLAKGFSVYYDAEVSITHKGSTSKKREDKARKYFLIRETKKSLEIYLREYRGFSVLSRWLCKTMRGIIILLSNL